MSVCLGFLRSAMAIIQLDSTYNCVVQLQRTMLYLVCRIRNVDVCRTDFLDEQTRYLMWMDVSCLVEMNLINVSSHWV